MPAASKPALGCPADHACSSAPIRSMVSIASIGQPLRTSAFAAVGWASRVHIPYSGGEAIRHKGCNPGATRSGVALRKQAGSGSRCNSLLNIRSDPAGNSTTPAWEALRVEGHGIRRLEGTRSMSRAQSELFDTAQGQLRGGVRELLRDEIEQRIRDGREKRRRPAPRLHPGSQQAAPNVALEGRQSQKPCIDRAPGAPRSFNSRSEPNSRAPRRRAEAGALGVDPGGAVGSAPRIAQHLVLSNHSPW
jgi:hypothetical protein